MHDGAVVDIQPGRLAFTTDSYVVQPLFFSGGDIGTLAVNGTVNDLAMCGAQPLYLSSGFIIEEGLPMETLWAVVRSMRDSAEKASVRIVTGDTKVVDKGKGDGLFINTAGVGIIQHQRSIGPLECEAGRYYPVERRCRTARDCDNGGEGGAGIRDQDRKRLRAALALG